MEMYKVKLYGISNVILKDHKKHYKLQGDVGLVRRLLVEADGLDDDLGDGVRVAVAARPPVLQVAVTLLRALPAPITAQYCYSGPITAQYCYSKLSIVTINHSELSTVTINQSELSIVTVDQ